TLNIDIHCPATPPISSESPIVNGIEITMKPTMKTEASFTSRRAYASVFMVGFIVISMPFTIGLSEEIGGVAGQWMSMFSVSNIPMHVNDIIFGGDPSEMTEDALARKFAPSMLVAWWAAWTVIPLGALWSRYRRLTP
ncbi:MAG TPA: hypothetical protein VE861_09675, partial [Gemmatimonadaceae bacterium]|nr:hypothetical protein [Gemmatimonadaceae bacterium]